nr:hypothetical protein HK105_001188 [Polyrhizophydium stewartii]
MLFAATAAVLALASAASAQIPLTYTKLADERKSGRMVFLQMTPEQKNTVLTNAETLLTYTWVNYESKLRNYPDHAADPFPVLKKLRANIKTITDEELQLGLTDAFVQIRDLHTRFFKTGPYRCFAATNGLSFELVEGLADIVNSPKVVVSAKSTVPALVALTGDDYARVNIGDELVSIDGKSFAKWFEENQYISGDGANTFGGHRRAIDFLGYVPGSVNRLPTKDSITFQFRDNTKAYGKVYTVTLPYIAARNDFCWPAMSALYNKLTNTTLPGTPNTAKFAPAKLSPEMTAFRAKFIEKNPLAVAPGFDEDKEIRASIFGEAGANPLQLNSTSASSVKWGIWDPKGRNLGVIQLTDFEPVDPNGAAAPQLPITVIRDLATHELKDTNAIVFDIRDNGGGYISMANNLPQLFRAEPFNPFGAWYLRNNVTFNLFAKGKPATDPWRIAYEQSQPGDRYTHIALFNPVATANTVGQAYVRPVAVLNNGRCYSACDMFSANIQDSATGTIFGEDGQTGAGGANILELPALITSDPADFVNMPFVNNLTVQTPTGPIVYANRLSVGIRQSVRNGRNMGRLIEDLGIKADYIVRARRADIMPGAKVNSQFDRIADRLAQIGAKTGQSSLHFVAEPLTTEATAGNAGFDAEIGGFDDISLYKADGVTKISSVDVSGTANTRKKIRISTGAVRSGLGTGTVRIVGTKNGKVYLKTARTIRVVPSDADRFNLASGDFVLGDVSKSTGVYNAAGTAAADGFNRVNGTWRFGDGTSYKENTDSSIEMFFTAPPNVSLSVTANMYIDTEPGYDFVYLTTKYSDGATIDSLKHNTTSGKVLPGFADKNRTIVGTISIPTRTGKFSVIVRATSDEAVVFSGVKVNALTISIDNSASFSRRSSTLAMSSVFSGLGIEPAEAAFVPIRGNTLPISAKAPSDSSTLAKAAPAPSRDSTLAKAAPAPSRGSTLAIS